MEFTKDQIQYLRDEIVRYAEFWVGKPYIWAGSDFEGFDCSGFVIECAKRVGLLTHSYDGTAHALYQKFISYDRIPNTTLKGCFIFWGNLGKIKHIELMVDNFSSIGASGGGSPKFDVYEEIMRDPILYKLFDDYDRTQIKAMIASKEKVSLRMIERELLRFQASDQDAYIKIRTTDGREPFLVFDPFLSLKTI